jgi:hypothetical protein
MLRKMFSLGALVVVAVTFGVSNAAAKPPAKGDHASPAFSSDGFSDGRMQSGSGSEGFSDGRF